MDSETIKGKSGPLSQENLLLIRKEKLRKNIESASRLLNTKKEPLEIADLFIHNTFKLVEDGILNRFPHMNAEEVKEKVKESLVLSAKLKKVKKRSVFS
ncbi:MAG: hypothetical protein HWN81_11660 [Candidatus Lokiarchaeota archaeon]|nr:hypothetical protein [Candidatus Lokiarchaeota archaeon]